MPSDRFLVVAAKKAHLAALLLPLLVLWCGLRVAGVARRCWAEFLCGLGQMSLWMGHFVCGGLPLRHVCAGAAGLSIYRSARMMAGMAKAALRVAAPVYWHT